MKGKARYRHFTLGLSAIDIDPKLFGYDPKHPKVSCGYKDGNINQLDILLCERWDVFSVSDFVHQFVTQLAIFENKDGWVSGSVRTAVFREELHQDYRQQLAEHLQEHPPQDILADEEDLDEGHE